ncbi:MAG: TolC family protein [Verrucomicrobia bacterium]|nr:TolC family protein [Verrucomicrobiota bacterium]
MSIRPNPELKFSPGRFGAVACLLAAVVCQPLAPLMAGESKAAPAAGPRVLTLDQAIQIALKQNPDIQKQLQEIQRTRGQIIQVTAQAVPNLVSSGSFNYVDNRLRTGGGGSSSSQFPTGQYVINPVNPLLPPIDLATLFYSTGTSTGNSSYSINLQVQQLIYNGGAVGAAIRAARLTADNSYYQLRETVEQIVSTTKNQFAEVLLNESLITIQQEQVKLLGSQLKDQQNRFEAGTVPRFDVLQAEVALANQYPLLINAQNNFRLSQIRLARTLGVDYQPDRNERPPFKCVGRLDVTHLNVSIPDAVAVALENRASLKLAKQNISVQQENLSVQKAGYQPTIRGSFGHQLTNDRRAGGDLTRTDNGFTAGLTMTWNVFDGGATYGNVRQARATLISSAITYEDTRRGVELEVQDALFRLRQSRELVNSQRENVGKAEEALRLSRARLSAGAGTQLDVLNAQVALSQAQVTELQARFNYNVALSDLRRATGTSTVYFDNFTDPASRRDAAQKSSSPLEKVARKVGGSSKPRPEAQKIDARREGALVQPPRR